MNTDGNEETVVDPHLRLLQRKLGEVISVTSLELIAEDWLSGTAAARAQKKYELLLEAMRLAKSLEGKLKND